MEHATITTTGVLCGIAHSVEKSISALDVTSRQYEDDALYDDLQAALDHLHKAQSLLDKSVMTLRIVENEDFIHGR